MNTNQLALENLLTKTPFTISYHFDMADLLIMEEDEIHKDAEASTILDEKLNENNFTIRIQTYHKTLLCKLDNEVFELYPLKKYLYDEWLNLLKLCSNQYKCMVSDIKPYKGGIIDTYEGVSFDINSFELVLDGKAIVPTEIEEVEAFYTNEKSIKEEAKHYKDAFTIIEERSDYLYLAYKNEKYEVKEILGYFEIYNDGTYVNKGISKDEVYKLIFNN
ncbi:MAG: Unknown protein [uncultured Sulfurovum sp.]|uniref:Uncharacterized protein n=1 Tax=uncultured Sulfurovum sp. TaxID=269237 RepID=A0A6S6RTJ9_9BACT|nr:MAG: Unknown protein [uncultured Sulfurovum sp.]